MTESKNTVIAEEARDWLVRLTSGDVTEEEMATFKQWQALSVHHDDAFARERQLWQDLSAVEPTFVALGIKGQSPSENDAVSVTSAALRPGRAKSVAAVGRPIRKRHVLPRFGAALALAVCLFVAVAGYVIGPGVLINLQADHQTGYDEIAVVPLPDGSQMTLNRNSAVEVAFSDSYRQIRILRGEAFFKVASNPKRPFQVLADEGVSQAVGTAYSVRRTEQGVRVAVAEGLVAVSTQQNPAQMIDLKAGQALQYESRGELGAVYALPNNIALAWQRDRLVFIKQSLSDLLANLQNYHRSRIVVLSGDLNQEVSGTINLDSLDEGLAAVAATQDLKVFQVSPYLTIVR